MKAEKSKKKCRGCGKPLTVSRCFPDDPSIGWAYLYCTRSRCSVSVTERQGTP